LHGAEFVGAWEVLQGGEEVGEGHGFMVWGLRPLVAGFDRGIDGGLAAELEEGGVEFGEEVDEVFAFAGGELGGCSG
jgi:hypothetical protein